ncbi:hypothetical protein TSPI_08474 [Trichinella spiralis]|uniref:Uncharacterized protein n=1 Tax=Trichinella spiralis TaxID=6334 RepID=A0ABR3L202_TRISP
MQKEKRKRTKKTIRSCKSLCYSNDLHILFFHLSFSVSFAVGGGIGQKGNYSTQKRTGPPLIRPSQWWWSKAITNWSPSPVVCKRACNERAMLALEQKLVFAELTSHVTSEQANKPENGAMKKKKKMMMKMQRPKLFNYAARRMAKVR